MLQKQTFISFLYLIIQYLSYTPFISLLNKSRIESKKCIFFAIFNALITSISTLLFPNFGVMGIFFMLLFGISSMIIFNMNTSSSLAVTLVCSSISFVINIFCLSLNLLAFSNKSLIYCSLVFLTIIYIYHKFLCIYDTKEFFNCLKTVPELYFLILILIFSYNFTSLLNLDVSCILLFIQTCFVTFILQVIKANYAINRMKLTISNLNFEYNRLKAIIDDIRMFKHDYNNTLCSIGGYISLNDMNGLKRFYNKLTFDINKTNNTQIITPSNINEPSIYNLLITKHNNIIQKNLNFNFYSAINYKDLTISPYDFSKILGIFLDNAIDAATKSYEKEISLSCELNKNKDFQIIIKNSYINKDVDVNKIFLKGYSSKDIKSGLRSMGGF